MMGVPDASKPDIKPAVTPPALKKKVNLALQGGGAHGAGHEVELTCLGQPAEIAGLVLSTNYRFSAVHRGRSTSAP